MSGSFCDDLIFPFFAIFLNRKLLNQQNLYSVSISIRRFIYRKKELTQIKNGSHFPHFSIVCDTRKKLDMQICSRLLRQISYKSCKCFNLFHDSYHDCQFHTSQTKRFKLLLFLIGELGMINIYENKKDLTYSPPVSKYMRFSGFPTMVFYSCSLTNLFYDSQPIVREFEFPGPQSFNQLQKGPDSSLTYPCFWISWAVHFLSVPIAFGYTNRFINFNCNIFEFLFFF